MTEQKKYRWLEENAIEVQGALVFLEWILEDMDQALPNSGYQRRFFQQVEQSLVKFHHEMRTLVDAFQHQLTLDANLAEERKKP